MISSAEAPTSALQAKKAPVAADGVGAVVQHRSAWRCRPRAALHERAVGVAQADQQRDRGEHDLHNVAVADRGDAFVDRRAAKVDHRDRCQSDAQKRQASDVCGARQAVEPENGEGRTRDGREEVGQRRALGGNLAHVGFDAHGAEHAPRPDQADGLRGGDHDDHVAGRGSMQIILSSAAGSRAGRVYD